MQLKQINSFRTASILIAGLAVCVSGTAAYAKTAKVGFQPHVDARMTVMMPDGNPRVYPAPAGGQEYYTTGLPIQKGDKAKLNVFVATGAYELKHIKVRLDNQLVADVTAAPWDATFDTSSMAVGNHMIEIWAQSDSPPPTSSDTATLTFFIADKVAQVPSTIATAVPTPGGVTTKVSPFTGTLGTTPPPVAPTPGTGTTATPTDIITLPNPIADAQRSDAATVAIHLDNSSAQGDHEAGKPITLDSPTRVIVTAPAGSTAVKYVYALVRNNATVYAVDHTILVNTTRILLQPRTETNSGLMPGTVSLEVWGVDAQGKYGPPTMLDITVPDLEK